jgi:hypothetical protein
MEDLYHGDFGTLDFAPEPRIEREESFLGSESGTAERERESVNGGRWNSIGGSC